jgi:triosephosphate isomerase
LTGFAAPRYNPAVFCPTEPMRTKLIAGNWKMHGNLADNAKLLAALNAGFVAVDGVAGAVCVPAPYLAQAQSALTGKAIAWGAQNVSEHAQGAFTGEISVGMLKDFGCRYAIVGHSERRAIYGETDAQVAAKAVAAIAGGLTPIVCIGETLAERDGGQTLAVVARQLAAVLSAVGAAGVSKLVLAYEPVWAIGTGRTASPQQAQEVHAALREQVAGVDAAAAANLQILYGGSVKPGNAREIFAQPDVDGGLIGGAALVADDFLAICAAAR